MNISRFEHKEVPVSEMRPLISRARMKGAFKEMKDSMRDVGLISPPQVIDCGRKREDGTRYDIVGGGEGRWKAAKELGWKTMPVLVIKNATDAEAAGRFLAENMIRKPLPWAQKGRMIRDQVAEGKPIETVAKELRISLPHAEKYLRVINKVAAPEIEGMSMNDAEVLTTLPARGQSIVIEMAAERGQPVREVARAARLAVEQHGAGWTKASLEKAMRSKDDELARLRNRLKVLRLHRAIGPTNIETMMENPKFVRACAAHGVNLAYFQ